MSAPSFARLMPSPMDRWSSARGAPTRSRPRPYARRWAPCSRGRPPAGSPPAGSWGSTPARSGRSRRSSRSRRSCWGWARSGKDCRRTWASEPGSRSATTVPTRSTWPWLPPWRCTTSRIGWPLMAEGRFADLREEAESAIAAAGSAGELEELRVRFLGRKAELTRALRSIGDLPPDERGPVGKEANQVKRALEWLLEDRTARVEAGGRDRSLAEARIDPPLPGDPPQPTGHLHLVSQIRRELEDTFVGLGFEVLEGPEVEYEYYNFTALNHPPEHPARSPQDTFYLGDHVLLRTHTSPMQVRAMEAREPPIYVVVPGRVYRPDTPDATHVPMFHQLEGLAVDEDITLADLQGVLLEFARAMFGHEREVRLRPGYFPFTEPSVEVDVSCFVCNGSGFVGTERCPTCKGEGWVEILGAGMVDPNVFEFVRDGGYDPERIQGFAFGMGIERIAALKHGVPDLRMLWENDVRLLEQFGA